MIYIGMFNATTVMMWIKKSHYIMMWIKTNHYSC